MAAVRPAGHASEVEAAAGTSARKAVAAMAVLHRGGRTSQAGAAASVELPARNAVKASSQVALTEPPAEPARLNHGICCALLAHGDTRQQRGFLVSR